MKNDLYLLKGLALKYAILHVSNLLLYCHTNKKLKYEIFIQIYLRISSFFACRFQSVAYLQQIWWFEVDGEVDFPFPVGSYSIFYRLQVGRASRRFGKRICNSEHVHGWDKKPVQFQLSTSDKQQATTQCYLKEAGKWKYHHVGDFVVTGSTETMKVKFSMTQIDCTHTKGGLCVDSVLICPSEFTERLKRF